MLETASRIHSANGGVRASQALDAETGAFADVAIISGAIFVLKRKKISILLYCLETKELQPCGTGENRYLIC